MRNPLSPPLKETRKSKVFKKEMGWIDRKRHLPQLTQLHTDDGSAKWPSCDCNGRLIDSNWDATTTDIYAYIYAPSTLLVPIAWPGDLLDDGVLPVRWLPYNLFDGEWIYI